ncbi:MAG: hypothetical protein Rhob2KO_34240 [Rhodopirellula baltica]
MSGKNASEGRYPTVAVTVANLRFGSGLVPLNGTGYAFWRGYHRWQRRYSDPRRVVAAVMNELAASSKIVSLASFACP